MRVWEVFWAFLKLGLTSFGGPMAHIAFFRAAFVSERRWLGEAEFAELTALAQALPGPTSSQVGFAIGRLRAGLAGGAAAFLGFTLPSFAVMAAAGAGVAVVDPVAAAPLLKGLKIAALAVVAQALLAMAGSLAPDRPRQLLAFGAAAALLFFPHPLGGPIFVALGALLGWLLRGALIPASASAWVRAAPKAGGRGTAIGAAALFALLLIGLPLAAALSADGGLQLAAAHAWAGALVFGGGHVVLPMLEGALVQLGHLTSADFLAGYGLAQAMPGPLFAFAAFTGAAASLGPGGLAGALIATLALFAPGFLLMLAILPVWRRLKAHAGAQAALAGAGASVVGVLAAALVNPMALDAIARPADAGLALLAFGALTVLKAPAPLVVIAAAGAGYALALAAG